MNNRYISYLRVSTARQGQSGLGLSAQQEAINSFIDGTGGSILGEFVEVESAKGSGTNRPKLQEAMEACRRTGSTLLIAKLDRLSRNVAFISNLMESGIDFTACDFPQANRLTIHLLAAVAEHEREMISKRTREALQAAKAKGIKLGSPQNLTKTAADKGRRNGTMSQISKANSFALDIYPTIKSYLDQGLSLKKTAEALNSAGILTSQGKVGSWTHTAVRSIKERASKLEQCQAQ